MQVNKISVKKRVKLPDGQSMEIALSGYVNKTGIDDASAKLLLQNVLNSGVITILRNELVKPIEERYRKPVEKVALNIM
jgi:hypothetical protein